MFILPLLLLTSAASAAPHAPKPSAAASSLPAPLENFLGAPPARFEPRFLRPARDLKAAQQLLIDRKLDAAIKKLSGLVNTEMGEHALFELANAYREKREFAKSTTEGDKLIRGYPGSVYFDRIREILDDNDCDQGLTAKGDEANRLLERCLWRAPWKTWADHEAQAIALYEHFKAAKDPLLDPLTAEIIQAMPAGSALRQRLAREVPAEKLEELASPARFHTKTPTAPGVKPVNPDADLFDLGMKSVLKEDWKEANAIFRRFPAEFPQSEHWDRAQYWIARTDAKLGNSEEAKKRFTQILADSPLSYYGLQAALFLGHDWLPQISQPAPPLAAKWEGSLTTRQALSLWRLRALLITGLVDYAREEAKTLGAARANGAGIGQEDPRGALLMAKLFAAGGNYMAAFSQAYAGLSLDPSLLNRESVSLIFPQPFLDDFGEAATSTGVSTLLLLSVAKQESAFLPNAISRSDALGLMQLLPVTAREVLPGSGRADLFVPRKNAQAGALYLYKLLDKFQGNIALTLAAYNAGPNRASQWMRDLGESKLMKEGFDPDAFIDSIPFTETRKYVGNILRNLAWYKMLTKEGPVTSVQELMFQWQKNLPKAAVAPQAPSAPPPPAAAPELPGPNPAPNASPEAAPPSVAAPVPTEMPGPLPAPAPAPSTAPTSP